MCPRTPFCPARSVNVHLDVFRQLFGVIEAPVARPTIADEPGNGFGFVCSEVFRLLQTTDVFVIVLPAIDDAQMLMIVTLSDMHACQLLPNDIFRLQFIAVSYERLFPDSYYVHGSKYIPNGTTYQRS